MYERQVLGMPTPGAGIRPLRQPASHWRSTALPDRLGVLLTPLSGCVSRLVWQLAAREGWRQEASLFYSSMNRKKLPKKTLVPRR